MVGICVFVVVDAVEEGFAEGVVDFWFLLLVWVVDSGARTGKHTLGGQFFDFYLFY